MKKTGLFHSFETWKPLLALVVLALAAVAIVAVPCAVASEGGGGQEGAEEHPSLIKMFAWPVINFLVLVAILWYGMKKADIKGYFRKRTELIEQSLKEAREAKELAQKALAEVEERLKIKDREIQDIIDAAQRSGESEKSRLMEEGDKLRERILEQARTNIEYELKNAKASIKAEAVEIAMELAEKKMKEKLTKDEQLKLLEESLAKIEGKK